MSAVGWSIWQTCVTWDYHYNLPKALLLESAYTGSVENLQKPTRLCKVHCGDSTFCDDGTVNAGSRFCFFNYCFCQTVHVYLRVLQILCNEAPSVKVSISHLILSRLRMDVWTLFFMNCTELYRGGGGETPLKCWKERGSRENNLKCKISDGVL